jgi:hypothetical protein
MRSVLFGLLQLAGALAAAAGTYLLLDLAWSLVIVGSLVFLVATGTEIMGARPAPPRAHSGAELPPRLSTELPGAARSRPRKEA